MFFYYVISVGYLVKEGSFVMNVGLLSTIGLVLLILSGIGAIAGIVLKNNALIYGSLAVFGVVFAAYFILLPMMVAH